MLADDPGLGKTLQAIRAADKANALRVLVVCPANLIANWKREIEQVSRGDWTADLVSYNMASGSKRGSLLADDKRWDVCVIDEGHALKDPEAKRTTAVYGKRAEGVGAVISRCSRVWVLTGTPMPNHAGELFTHVRALRPDLIASKKTGLPWTYFQFLARYTEQRNTGFGMKITGSKNEAELHALLKSFMLRRRKADVLKDLPPIRFGEIALSVDARGFPEDQAELVRAALAEGGIPALRTLSMSGSVSELRRFLGAAKVGPAADWIEDWLASTDPSQKLVVFCHHQVVIEELYHRLQVHAVRIYGKTKASDDDMSVKRFQSDPLVRVFIGNITKAGVGITLTAASELVFVESSWVPAEVEQAAQRIHRIGQTEHCLVRFMHVAGSIDEDIQRAIRRKTESIVQIIDGESVE